MKCLAKIGLLFVLLVTLTVGTTGCEMVGNLFGGLFGGSGSKKASETNSSPDQAQGPSDSAGGAPPAAAIPPPPTMTPYSAPSVDNGQALALSQTQAQSERVASAWQSTLEQARLERQGRVEEIRAKARQRRLLNQQNQQLARERAAGSDSKQASKASQTDIEESGHHGFAHRPPVSHVPSRCRETYRSKLRRHNTKLRNRSEDYRRAYENMRGMMERGRTRGRHVERAYGNYRRKLKAFRHEQD